MAKQILIADDSVVFRNLEAAFLERGGYEVLHAQNGAETVRMAVQQEPDLILLDIQMPIMDGVQVLGALRKTETTRDIPVVIVTTIGREKDRDLLVRGGAAGFLSKPIDGTLLLETVERLIGS